MRTITSKPSRHFISLTEVLIFKLAMSCSKPEEGHACTFHRVLRTK